MAQRPWEIRVKVAEQYLKFLIKQKGIGRGTGYFEWIWEEI